MKEPHPQATPPFNSLPVSYPKSNLFRGEQRRRAKSFIRRFGGSAATTATLSQFLHQGGVTLGLEEAEPAPPSGSGITMCAEEAKKRLPNGEERNPDVQSAFPTASLHLLTPPPLLPPPNCIFRQ